MPAPKPPDARRKTFSENLADRPRARFFTTFAILGFAVTPVALMLIFHEGSVPDADAALAETPEVRLEAIIGAILLAAHFLCIFFAWMFYRDEGQTPDQTAE